MTQFVDDTSFQIQQAADHRWDAVVVDTIHLVGHTLKNAVRMTGYIVAARESPYRNICAYLSDCNRAVV